MFIVEVSPLLKAANLESLTYYSGIEYEPGSLVKIPVRNQETTGLILSCKPVSAARAAVRAATFSLRRLPEQEDAKRLSPLLVRTAMALMDEVPASFGSILFSLLPPPIRNGDIPYPDSPLHDKVGRSSEVTVLSGLKEERYAAYKSQVREAFAHRGSVLFVAPTAHLASEVAESLSGGIKDRVVLLSPSLTAKGLARAIESFLDLSTAKLIIATPGYAFLDRHDITRVIVEGAGSPYYRGRERPYLDYKRAVIKMAALGARDVILGDLLHQAEDEERRRAETYETKGEAQNRVLFKSAIRFLNAKDKPDGDKPFEIFSPDLRATIGRVLSDRRNVFIYAARRGLAPVVACADCGHIFRDPHSGTPYSLFRTFKNGEEKRWFLSSISGRRVKASDNCPVCGSWRLRERGIGIQYIEDDLRRLFPDNEVLVFDHESAATERKANSIISRFKEGRGAVLLGTSMALPYLPPNISLGVVPSLDAARAVPTWRVEEQCFSLLLRLREAVEDELIVQTRSEPDDLFEYVKGGQTSQFYTDELKLREELSYPPFARFVHLTMKGKEEMVKQEEAMASALISDHPFAFYSSPDSTPENTTRYGLLRVPRAKWPDPGLMDRLRLLPPAVKVEIDPDRLV